MRMVVVKLAKGLSGACELLEPMGIMACDGVETSYSRP